MWRLAVVLQNRRDALIVVRAFRRSCYAVRMAQSPEECVQNAQARAVVCIARPFQIDGGLASPPLRSMRRAETSAETEPEGLVRDEVHLRSEKVVSVDRKLRRDDGWATPE